MMGKMRDMTKWMLYILILAFVGLMVVEWGADYSGLSQRSQTIVGEIEGEEITYDQFNEMVRRAAQIEQQRTGTPLTDEQVKQLRNRVWEQEVQRIVLKKEIEKLNIRTSDDDVANYILNALTQQYRNDPNFQTNGVFDPAKLSEILAHPDNKGLLISMERQAAQDLPYAKLLDLINASVIVTEQELRDDFSQRNVKAKIEFLGVPVSAFRDDSLEISEAELQQFYHKHKEDFKVGEKRQLNYVFFSTTPTQDDTARVYQQIEDIKKQVLAGKDFNELAVQESEDPSAPTNRGDLGYFDRNAMVKEFSDAAFAASPGDIVGPVKTRFGLHLIKVIDKKKEDGVEKVHAAHILKKFEPGYATIDNARENAERFATLAKEEGFAAATEALGVEVKQTPAFVQNQAGQIPGVGRMEMASVWAFSNEKDEVSDVFSSDAGYYVFQIAEIQPAGFQPFEEVKNIVRSRVENEKRKELAKKYAEKFADQVGPTSDFQEIAASDEKKILKADTTGYFTANVFVPKIGRAPEIVARAFSLPLNEVSELIETERGYYYIRVKDRIPFDEEAFAREKADIRKRLVQQKARVAFAQWYNKLKEEAKIVDNRYRFYRS